MNGVGLRAGAVWPTGRQVRLCIVYTARVVSLPMCRASRTCSTTRAGRN